MTDFKLDQRAIDKMAECGIPEYMRGGLIRYYNNRIPPGDFLIAVLENDLMEAFNRADDTNQQCMKAYVMWLYNYAPGRGFGRGSRKAVTEWLNPEEEAA